MTTSKTMAAEALYPKLLIFHSVSGQPLRAVWQIRAEGSVEKLVLDFDAQALVVSADENDDSVEVGISTAARFHCADRLDVTNLPPWNGFIGKPFGWGWVTVNQQGYCDGLLLSFGGIVPQLVVNVVASSIKIGVLGPLS